jgi:hypothetical protein
MTSRVARDILLELLEGDEELLGRLYEAGLVPRGEQTLAPEHAETARVVHTLAHELEVNWAGVEVIVRMRSELVATRRQVAELVEVLRRRKGPGQP